MTATRLPPSPLRIAVVGPGEGASAADVEHAELAARLIARRGWVVLCGGVDSGVMAAAARGAREGGGLSVGILPGADDTDAAPALGVALPTGLGEARNAVLVRAAQGVLACGMSTGTASEVALALRLGRPTVLVGDASAAAFFAAMEPSAPFAAAATPAEAVGWLAERLRGAER